VFLDSRELLSLLGSADAYAAWVADGVLATTLDEHGVPLQERPPLTSLLCNDSDQAIAAAHFRHGYSISAVARHLGVNRSQISRRLALRR
jgi:DNA-binding NtrC family response regulator